jgi:leucyl/phenylalanyl-tRNA--protein transferase
VTSRQPIEPPSSRYEMPDPLAAPPGEDLVAVGADLEPGTLLAGYRRGLFPMPDDPDRRRARLAWYSPDPRAILPLDGLRITRSLRRSLRRYEVRHNHDFRATVEACADPDRPNRWISPAYVDAYVALHELGWTHSFESYLDNELVGGLYGVRIDSLFAGEAMFHRATDASKVALVSLVDWLNETRGVLLDVQWQTEHLASLGAVEIRRTEYLELLRSALDGIRES